MKKSLLYIAVLLFVLISGNSYSLTNFNYKGIALNNIGQILPGTTVNVQITISTTAGGVLYQESHPPVTTDQFGSFVVEVGSGTVVSGALAGITTTADTRIKVETNVGGGPWVLSTMESLSKVMESALNDITDYAWALAGNAVTPNDFLGTTNDRNLYIAVTDGGVSGTVKNSLMLNKDKSIYREQSAGVHGHVRGISAVDWQIVRNDNRQIASGNYSVIGGGSHNTASKKYTTIGGGNSNTASGDYATAGGGISNAASGDYATAGGGFYNSVGGNYSISGGGYQNEVIGNFSVIAGGGANQASSWYTTISGGIANLANERYATIGGGGLNKAVFDYATVCGGYKNEATARASTIGGGSENQVLGDYGTVGGGYKNLANAELSPTVGGGNSNKASADYSTVAGGQENTASYLYSTVGGGHKNTASNDYSTAGGGRANTASGASSTVSGGRENTASSYFSIVGGGRDNTASGANSTIGGGRENIASTYASTISGGYYAVADKYGQNAYASGRFANAGDAQTSVFVVRNTTTNASNSVLYLNGSVTQMTLNDQDIWTFRALVIGSSDNHSNYASYVVTGFIHRNGVTTSITGVTTTTVAESSAGYNATAIADNTNEALVIQVIGDATNTMRWVARVEVVQLNY